MREGVRRILSDSWFEIVETVDHLRELDADLSASAEIHILVIDRSLLGVDGAATVAATLASFPDTRIVTLVDSFDFSQMVAIYAAGAHAYFLDHVPYQALVAMMQMVAIGQKVAPPELVDLLGNMLLVTSHSPQNSKVDSYNLNERERMVLGHLGQGLPNKAIARDLGVSESAMKASVKSILKKLGVRNRTQAAVMARELSLGKPSRQPGESVTVCIDDAAQA
ncbi:response regulator transcription factor [Novosphingobium sp. PhB165]|uniref:LuxR C-terminal-related transcriptional regulator n=1 Tax=Novosphingobium sp. PhB165 TaxID=2485105 RepID=UPI001FB220D5|nr:response regulator transcription factor [Novosphingobium sp. PhB165]